MIRTLFIPVEISTDSYASIRYGVELARQFNSKIILFHAYALPYVAYTAEGTGGLPYGTVLDSLEDEMEITEKQLKLLLHEAPGLNEVEYELVTKQGLAGDLIVDEISECEADLVVMSTGGASGAGELLGTMAEKITRLSVCPVLVIPNHYTYLPIERISLALAEDNMEEEFSDGMLIEFVKKFDASFDVIHVREYVKEAEENHHIMYSRLQEGLRGLLEFTSFRTILSDDKEGTIVDYVHRQNVNLLALVYREHGILKRIFNPGLRKKLVFHTDIPLLILK